MLPERLARQRELADDYARDTERDAAEPGRQPADPRDFDDRTDDPLRNALAAAELDDEPFTDEERAAARGGWEAYERGESTPWEDVRQALLKDVDASKISTS